ncbi:MAG: efflux RND transporter periplasmic adaptor subunit [Myxococcales bacterium]|nr:efflux RND transporter periplasmic adaptor subunit [Myxococcales bacterium]
MRFFLYTIALALCVTSPALAHEGEDHAAAPGTESAAGAVTGPIEVSEVAQRNLGLTVGAAELRSVETTLRVIGEIQADPARSGTVSSRISGRASAVFAQEGERVEKGKWLVEVESLQLGDPPPRVRYASPVNGIVTDRHVVVGDDVEPNRHLFEVVDLSEVLAVGRVFEGQIGQVAVGQKVRVRVPSYPEDVFEGVVERLGGKLDPTSRSLAVYVRVANPDERLRPHMRATLSLITGGADLALAIPKSAVLGEAGNLYAFVQDEERSERFERRPLTLGVSNDRFVEVIEGLYPGERVVTEGNYSLQYLTPVVEKEESENPDAVSEGDGEVHAHSEGPFAPAILWALGAVGAVVVSVLGVRMLRGRSRTAPEAR